MKSIAIIILATVFLPLVSFADDFSLSDGREYKGVTVSRIEKDGVVVITNDGVEKLPFLLMPKETRDLYPYVPSPTPPPLPVAPPVNVPAQTGTAASQNTQASPSPAATIALAPLPSTASRVVAIVESSLKQKYLLLLASTALMLLVALTVLACAWFIVRRLMASWISKQKAREFDFTNVRQFHSAYADFFAAMKLWNHCIEHNEDELPSAGEYELPHATRWELLAKAYSAESDIESLFLKLASTWNLDPQEIELLGRFRQAFRTLGESIRNNKAMKWNDPEAGDYLAFNRLASSVALLIISENAAKKTSEQRAETFRQITSNHWESVWNLTDAEAKAKGLPLLK